MFFGVFLGRTEEEVQVKYYWVEWVEWERDASQFWASRN